MASPERGEQFVPREIDYSNWMSNLSQELQFRPLIYLAIPGSHDSLSYSISRNSSIAPDDTNIECFNKIPCVNVIAKKIVYRWSLTQNSSVTEQLNAGIRYFDLRMAPNPATDEISIVHGLYGIQVQKAFLEVLSFLKTHSKEVILIDFQHFYNFTQALHENLITEIAKTFGELICPYTFDLEKVTLAWLWKSGFQVLIFYRNHASYLFPHTLWPADCIPNPWPNTVHKEEMIAFLESHYKAGRPINRFYVTQGVLTPDTCYVAVRLLSSLKNNLVGVANVALSNWLKDKQAGYNGINVVIFDFVNLYPDLLKEVIDLNFKPQPFYVKK